MALFSWFPLLHLLLRGDKMAAMPASFQMWKLQGWWQAWAPHSLQQCWESMLLSFGESRSMIHQKVFRECSRVSGFFHYQLAIPRFANMTVSPVQSLLLLSLCCCSDCTGGGLLKAVFVVCFQGFLSAKVPSLDFKLWLFRCTRYKRSLHLDVALC